jgi:serine/threonine-protein kinase PknG
MGAERCKQTGCAGTIEDGYCNVCGRAAVRTLGASAATSGSAFTGARRPFSVVTTGLGSSPVSRAGRGSRRTSRSISRTTRRQLGAGLVTLPELPSTEPENALLADPKVPEKKRFCPKCEAPLRREAGFCGKCGQKYSFVPSLKPGDMAAGQYQVKGAIAYGGLGWIYLGFDTLLSRYVVLKGLLNAHDESSAAAAVAERQFLAAVKHPNIVGIYNFVEHGGEGFIVMEYVGGTTLKRIRQERGRLPVAEAIAYIHRILPAFGYLHDAGLVYCDFKPDNVMLERDDVKLIDMGGVRRADDLKGDIYGTVGYSAPEAGEGPTPASDLFTIGRTLCVLLTDIPGFSNGHRYALPGPGEEPLFAHHESLYRFLLKATAEKPDDRFESADEMAEQLLGVLREVVSVESGTPRGGVSAYFGADLLALEAGDEMAPARPDGRYLPNPALDGSDAGFDVVSTAIAAPNLQKRTAALRLAAEQSGKSREARLRLAGALGESGMVREAETILAGLSEEDPWDWRVEWYSGRVRLVVGDAEGAQAQFDRVYFDLPGEVAPKLALALAAEMASNSDLAIRMYDLVTRIDPSYVSAAFGLARCLEAKGDRKGAAQALDRIPHGSAQFLRGRIEAARILTRPNGAIPGSGPKLEDVASASAVAEGLQLEGMNRLILGNMILRAALDVARTKAKANGSVKVLGLPLQEKKLRRKLEKTLRAMAQMATGEDRVRLVDEANAVRPRTLI